MKKIIKYLLMLIILLPMIFTTSCNEPIKNEDNRFKPLDYIETYQITINPNTDGTLNMHYMIIWKVLNDEDEGPLEWIKIGVPNSFIKDLKPLTSNIKSLNYSSDDGAYIIVDFDRKYYKNESITFEFSYTQERMYHLINDEKVYYNYVPGWFDEIRVGYICVKWNATEVIDSNHDRCIDGYLYWQSSLDYGQSLEIEVLYNQSSFIGLKENLQYSDQTMTKFEFITMISVLSGLLIFAIIMIIIGIKNHDPYMNNRGFVGRKSFIASHYHHHHYYSSAVNSKGVVIVNRSSSGSGISGSSCACACACAGGGRAGCSIKDFNHHSINHEDVLKILKNKSSSLQ